MIHVSVTASRSRLWSAMIEWIFADLLTAERTLRPKSQVDWSVVVAVGCWFWVWLNSTNDESNATTTAHDERRCRGTYNPRAPGKHKQCRANEVNPGLKVTSYIVSPTSCATTDGRSTYMLSTIADLVSMSECCLPEHDESSSRLNALTNNRNNAVYAVLLGPRMSAHILQWLPKLDNLQSWC